MSTSEPLAVGVMEDGTVVFYDPDAAAGIRRLGPARDDLTDLTSSVHIPTLSTFVKERRQADRKGNNAMKILRRDRGGDLTGPNSPYWIERAASRVWFSLRHPILMAFHRIVTIRLTGNTWVSPLWVYGNATLPAYSGVQFDGVEIEGDADSLRRLAALLLDRAERVEAVQAILDAGLWPTDEDATGFPAGFEREVAMQDERLGNAPRAGLRAGA